MNVFNFWSSSPGTRTPGPTIRSKEDFFPVEAFDGPPLVPGGGGGLHPMMEGDDNMELLECQLGEEEGEEGDESPRPVKKEKSDRERF